MKPLVRTLFSALLCIFITNYVKAATSTLTLQQPSDIMLGDTVTYNCISLGSGPDPQLRWFLREPTDSVTNVQELTNQATIATDTNSNDGEITSTLSIVVSSTYTNKRLWCSAYDQGNSFSTVDVYTDINVNAATLGQSCASLSCVTGTTCVSGICQCSSGYYDSNGASSGGTCLQQAGLGDSCNFASTSQCGTANSVCSSSSFTCVCQSGYTESNGACISGGLGSFCSATIACQTANSICVNNVCTCGSGYYDDNGSSTGGTCSLQVSYGSSCNPSIPNNCGGTNAVCSSSTNTCVCQSGYSFISGSCQSAVGLGSTCSLTSQCTSTTSQSSCINFICQCNSGYYDSNGNTLGGSCFSQVSYGGSCNPSIPNNCGGSNAACSSSTFRCECASGYSLVSGVCQFSVGLGSACSTTAQCSSGTSQSSCINNICQCNTGYYDSDGSTLGGSCLLQVSYGGSCNPSTPNNCGGSNVVCSSSTFRCECASGYSLVSGVCQFSVGLGSACSTTAQCSSGTSQSSCINNVCQCNTGYYDSDGSTLGGSCLLQVSYGGSCNPSTPNNCGGSNVVCSSSTFRCECAIGYTLVSGVCQASVGLGSSCSSTTQCTSATSQSSCFNNICQCNTNYYDSNGNTLGGSCLSQVSYGGTCNPSIPNNCGGTNAACSSTTNTCACASGYALVSGSCQSAVTLGNSCTTTTQCSSATAQSSCINSVCQCNTGYYDSNANSAGGSCSTKLSLGTSCPFTAACSDANAFCSGTCQCNTGYTNQGGICYSTSSFACPTSTQAASTTQGSISPIAPDVTIQATCYLVSLYGTQIIPCRDSKGATALRSGAFFKRNADSTFTQVVTSTGGFINGDITNPNLTMSNAQASYAGNYVCRLCYGAQFTQCTDSADIEVRIDGSDISSASITVDNTSPTRGSSVTFTCGTVPADAATSYTWTRNSVTLSDTGSTLVITNVGTGSSGSYSCTASNQFSSATSTSSVSLNVLYAPEYSLQGGTDTVTYFSDLSTASTIIQCTVSANPSVNSYSFFDATGTNLYTGTSNQLTVTSSMGYQRYYCTATNTVGTSPVLYLDVQQSSSPNTGAATEDDGGISTGVIAAIVIGIIFLLLLIIIIIVCCCNYGWCRKNEKKVEPEVIVAPPVKPYIPRAVLSDYGSEVSRRDVGITMNGHHHVSTEFEEPTLTPRYYLKPALNSGPIISMREDNYNTPRAHQLPALDTQYLYRDEEPKKKRRRRKKKRHHEPEPEPRYAEVQPPDDDDLVVIPGRNNYYE